MDANEGKDEYQHAIGFFVLDGGAPTAAPRKKLSLQGREGELAAASRLACTRQVCREVELLPNVAYYVLPCTVDPHVYMSHILTVASPAPATVEPVPPGAWTETPLRGAWSIAAGTAGGCPNYPDTWFQNPQYAITLPAAADLVGVLSLSLRPDESEELSKQQAQLTQAAAEAAAAGDADQAAALQAQAAELAPAVGFLLFKGDGALITGSYEEHAPRQVAASKFAHGTQEVSAELSGAEPGKYTLVMCTFAPQQEKAFAFTLFATSSSVKVEPLNGGRIDTGAAGVTSKRVPPSAPTYKSDAAKVAPPKASSKQDSAAIRAADDDDGKMGYAERMELEEAIRLEKWKENVPMMTIEGQPLSENVKKRRDALVAYATAKAQANGGLFEDSGGPYNDAAISAINGHTDHIDQGFPKAAGSAAGTQPEVYTGGSPGAHEHAVVTQWLRPSQMANVTSPMLFKNDFEVEGIIQGEGTTNRWLLSALNIIGGNREQLDRVFMEHDEAQGFFICKFYQDDPLSDDDWQVILVDDRIPCDAAGVPCFARCKVGRVSDVAPHTHTP